MLALKVASPEQDLGLLCSHTRVCLTSALIPHLENPRPSESELESSWLGSPVEGNAACSGSWATYHQQLRTSQSICC